MKLIAILVSLAVVILVVVGYDLLMKAAKKKNESFHEEMHDTVDEYHQQQSHMEKLKEKLTNEDKPAKGKPTKTKTKIK